MFLLPYICLTFSKCWLFPEIDHLHSLHLLYIIISTLQFCLIFPCTHDISVLPAMILIYRIYFCLESVFT